MFSMLDELESVAPAVRTDMDTQRSMHHLAVSVMNAGRRLKHIYSRLGVPMSPIPSPVAKARRGPSLGGGGDVAAQAALAQQPSGAAPRPPAPVRALQRARRSC